MVLGVTGPHATKEQQYVAYRYVLTHYSSAIYVLLILPWSQRFGTGLLFDRAIEKYVSSTGAKIITSFAQRQLNHNSNFLNAWL